MTSRNHNANSKLPSYILKQNGVKLLPESQVSARLANSPSAAYHSEFYNTAKKLKVKGLPPNLKAFITRWNQQGLPWRYSKYLGLLLVDIINTQSKKKQDALVTQQKLTEVQSTLQVTASTALITKQTLSETAKVIATYAFLRGYKKLKVDLSTKLNARFAPHIPPASDSNYEFSLLHPGILKSYFNTYNQEVQKHKSMEKMGRIPKFKSFIKTIERICG